LNLGMGKNGRRIARISAGLLTAAARIRAAKVDYATASEVPIRNRKHGANFTQLKKMR